MRIASSSTPRRWALLLALQAAGAFAGAPAGAPCADAKHHQFDFLVGDWVVTNPADGSPLGQNHIEAVLGGCALHEDWTGAKGGKGNSYSAYDAARGAWHQTWVDATGGLLLIDGGIQDGRMVMAGPQKQADGKTLLNRITWTPLAGGRVEQRWDTSADGGKTWQVQFDGIYARRTTGGGAAGSAAARRADI